MPFCWFCHEAAPVSFREFYSISDAFDPTNLIMRHDKRALYLTTPIAKSVIHSNTGVKDVRVG